MVSMMTGFGNSSRQKTGLAAASSHFAEFAANSAETGVWCFEDFGATKLAAEASPPLKMSRRVAYLGNPLDCCFAGDEILVGAEG